MRRTRLTIILGAVLLFLWPSVEAATTVRLAVLDGAIHPASAFRIEAAITAAEESGDALILLEVDTPGGLVDTTGELVQRILSSEVPVVVWVGPAGAHAASAGFFLLLASDVALMAPGTRTGAASTVQIGGENRDDDPLLRKMNEDGAALLRSISEHRGRNIEAAEKAVFEATAYEESKALELGLIDAVVENRDAVFAYLNGREIVRFDGTTVVLDLTEVQVVETEFDWLQDLRMFLALPVVAALLLMVGMGGIWIEMTHPGVVLPGLVGATALILFAFSASILPVSAVGLLLIALAVVMFILEVKVVSYGMLTLGGAVSLVFGGILLIDGPIPELRVPPGVIVPVAVMLTILIAFVMRLVMRAHRAKVATGEEGLVGETGPVRVTIDSTHNGRVWIHGELWSAVSSSETIEVGQSIRVVAVDGMRLTVETVAEEEQ